MAFAKCVGIGYDYHDIHLNVFPLFEDKIYAIDLWKKTFDSLDDHQIRIRFVEHEDNYWFIVYAVESGHNVEFVKNVLLSENYQKFREGFVDRVILRFCIYKKNAEGVTKNDGIKGRFEILRKSKTVTDVKFMKYTDLPSDSIEKRLVEVS